MTDMPEKTTSSQLEALLDRYSKRRTPIPVNFRTLVPWLKNVDRLTHLIHPYPAKLLVHIPVFFLSNNVLSQPFDTVLDPFSGSGTVLLEALVAERFAIGADSNPLARLISQVKTQVLAPRELHEGLTRILSCIPDEPSGPSPDVVNINHWFYPHVIKQLIRLRSAIISTQEGHRRDFFDVCFSVCVRKVSLADPRLSVPVRLRGDQYPDHHPLRTRTLKHMRGLKRVDTFRVFADIANANIARMTTLHEALPSTRASTLCQDARYLTSFFGSCDAVPRPLSPSSIQLIITSPPYVGSQKYVRAMELSIGWLGLCSSAGIRPEKDKAIGREEYRKEAYGELIPTRIGAADRLLRTVRTNNPLRAHIAAQYLAEMRGAIVECSRVLRPGGYLVLVAGNNTVCGLHFRTPQYLKAIAEEAGLSLRLHLIDDIKSRGLMTKRNKTAGLITQERVLLFQKQER